MVSRCGTGRVGLKPLLSSSRVAIAAGGYNRVARGLALASARPDPCRAKRRDKTVRGEGMREVRTASIAGYAPSRAGVSPQIRVRGMTSSSLPPITPPRKSIVDPGAHLLRDDIGLLRRAVGGDTERGESAREGRGRGHLRGVRLLRREREASMNPGGLLDESLTRCEWPRRHPAGKNILRDSRDPRIV